MNTENTNHEKSHKHQKTNNHLLYIILTCFIALSMTMLVHFKDDWINYILSIFIIDENKMEETIENAENKNKLNTELEIMNNIFIICRQGYKFAVYSDEKNSHIIQVYDVDKHGNITLLPCMDKK